MENIKASIIQMIYEGARMCFDKADYVISKKRPWLSYGYEITQCLKNGTLEDHSKIQSLYLEGYTYIQKNKIRESVLNYGLVGGITNNIHVLKLSIIGNKIDIILFSQMTKEEQISLCDHINYYSPDNVREALKFAENRIISLERSN